MELFLFMLLMLLLVGIGSFMDHLEREAKKKNEEELNALVAQAANKDKWCPPHTWAYHPVTDRLTCTRCNYVAGS